MAKVTIIMILNSENYHRKTIQNILKNTVYDFEIIFINNASSDLSKELINSYGNDSRIIIKELENNNLMKTFNQSIEEASGKYIIFTKNLNILLNDTLKRAYNKSEDKSADLLMFNRDENSTIISRIVGYNAFSFEKIRDYLFTTDFSLESFLYDVNFLKNNNIEFDTKRSNISLFIFKCILEANRILFYDKSLDIQTITDNDLTFYESLKNLEDIQKYILMENDDLTIPVNNYIIVKSIQKYDEENISKKESFTLLRNNFIGILQSDNSKKYINSLNKTNRKLFEQVIISESVEEYELLKNVSQDKNHINFMKRYEKILKVEHKKISNFNKSLTSSNSWKLTKVLRIKNKLK